MQKSGNQNSETSAIDEVKAFLLYLLFLKKKIKKKNKNTKYKNNQLSSIPAKLYKIWREKRREQESTPQILSWI